MAAELQKPDFCQLVRTFGLGDQRERLAEIGREWVLGGEDLQSGADLDGPVAPGGAYEPADRPTGALLHVAADGERGEHDAQVGFDGLAFVVVDRPGGQVVLGHAERGLDLEEPVVGVDHELRGDRGAVGAGGEVGGVGLPPGQCPGLGLQGAVHALVGADKLDEPVALDRCLARDRAFGLGDLLVDAVQRPAGAVGPVLVVDDLITALIARSGGPGLGQDQPVGRGVKYRLRWRLGSHPPTGCRAGWSVWWRASYSMGGTSPSSPWRRRWLYQSMYSATAISRSSSPCQGPLLRTSSALNRELNASAIALS